MPVNAAISASFLRFNADIAAFTGHPHTSLLDIKPYVSDFDCRKAERIGWLSGKSGRSNEQKSDDRFR